MFTVIICHLNSRHLLESTLTSRYNQVCDDALGFTWLLARKNTLYIQFDHTLNPVHHAFSETDFSLFLQLKGNCVDTSYVKA